MLADAILNSTILLLFNFLLISYTLMRMIRALLMKNNLQTEIDEFNSFVSQSRKSLDYVSTNVQEAVKEIKHDLARELEITHHFTQFEDRLSSVLKRFAKLQDEALEYLRMHPNMRSIQIETPQDISEEVKQILAKQKPESKPPTQDVESVKPTSPKKSSSKPNSIKKYSPGKKGASGDQPKDSIPNYRRLALNVKSKERAPKTEKRRFFQEFKNTVSEDCTDKLIESRKQSGFNNQSWVVHDL